MSRFVAPHGASVAGPEFTRKRGSRSEPAGPVYAMMTMGRPPWDALADKALACEGEADLGDLHTLFKDVATLAQVLIRDGLDHIPATVGSADLLVVVGADHIITIVVYGGVNSIILKA